MTAHRRARSVGLAVAAALAGMVGACSDRDSVEQPQPQRQRRVIEPPAGIVRPLPPFAIRADGVGPYHLGEPLDQLLKQLPSGPAIALFNIRGVVRRSLVRAEDDTVLIGSEPTSFVAVVGSEVARTESGIHVGSSRGELVRALGPTDRDPDHARDPRLIAPTAMRNLRAVMDGDRVLALVVLDDSDPRHPHPPPPVTPPTTTAPTPVAVPPVASTAPVAVPPGGTDGCAHGPPPVDRDGGPPRLGTCAIEVSGDELALRLPDADHAVTGMRLAGLQFASGLRDPASGRDELVAITRTDDALLRTWFLSVYRLDGAHLVRVGEPTQLYQLSPDDARSIGAELRGLDLYLEVTGHDDTIEVGGVLTNRVAGKLRDVVVISATSVARSGRPASEPAETGAGSAGSDLGDAHH